MRKKKLKRLLNPFKQLFRTRNIIVISEQAVDHYPVSGKLQLLGLAGVIGFFSWISFSTGSYMAAQSVLREKEQKIISTSLENKKIGEEYSLLKRDLLKLSSKDAKELSDYDSFILQQYAHDSGAEGQNFHFNDPDSILLHQDITETDGDDKLFERIAFLENHISELKSTNQEMVDSIRRITDNKITEFEDLIEMTGLHLGSLKQSAAQKREVERRKEEEDAAAAVQNGDFEGQGGPLIYDKPTGFELRERELVHNMDEMMLLYDIIDALPTALPVASKTRMTSGFGRRVDPFTKRWAMHAGVDFMGEDGMKVRASGDGIVSAVGKHAAYGLAVDIDHGLGVTTRYGHLSEILVKDGQHITQGQVIGVQGSTGRSTGAHLHYEVRYNNRPLNPKNFIEAGEYVRQK